MAGMGAISYGIGGISFLILTLLLLTVWRGRLHGGLLVLAAALTSAWAAILAYQAATHAVPVEIIWSMEIIRDGAWLLYLFHILKLSSQESSRSNRFLRVLEGVVFSLVGLLLISTVLSPYALDVGLDYIPDVNLLNIGHVLLAITGMALTEQLYRNTRPEQRWSIKFLCLGIAGLFVFDFYLYSDALLFQRIDQDIWYARGAANALVVPVIAISAVRNAKWSMEIFLSRGIVFHTATLLGAGIYMLVMAAAGYAIRYYGGTWGAAVQVIFLFGAVVLLLILFFSGQLRARIKVFINKHFFHYQYDYREEWLRLIRTLSSSEGGTPLYERAIRVLAEMVESPGGALWLRRESGTFAPVARWGIPDFEAFELEFDSQLVDYLQRWQWVIDFDEYSESPENYGELKLPEWMLAIPQGWMLVPMMHRSDLLAFAVLVAPRAPFVLNWESIDLLKTAGRQTASYLAQNAAAEALAEARQFEAFNRFSAFVIHDLKNLIAQLSLVVRNAAKHKENPEFMDDAIETIRHSVDKMNRLLHQLRTAAPGTQSTLVDVGRLVSDVVKGRAGQKPHPEISSLAKGLVVRGDRDRLASVIGHIVQNAQDATPRDGFIRVGTSQDSGRALIEVVDNGSGMDAAFIRDRLFRPFDTTKGLTGMGIGAYESRELIRALGGEIRVASEPGKGTRFQVYLPLAKTESDTVGTHRSYEVVN